MNKKIILLFYCVLLYTGQLFCFHVITYQQSIGRLGDQLIYYCIAKYIAFKYELPFYYRPFPLSDQLALSKEDPLYHEGHVAGLQKILIRDEGDFLHHFNAQKNQLFIIDHTHWQISSADFDWYGTNASKEYRSLIRKLIAPTYPIPTLKLPKDSLTVALHYRTGEGMAPPYFIAIQHDESSNNAKFRPFRYYVDQVKRLKNLFPDQKLYIQIFTDAIEPRKILDRFKKSFSDPLITFTTRKRVNSWKNNVFTDLFHMAQFNCLIRPRSGFSFIAQLIGFHKLILHPKGILWIENDLIKRSIYFDA